jgi:hypothetical protein
MDMLQTYKVSEFEGLHIVWNKESWLSCVYANTHSTKLPGFIAKEDMRYTHEDQSLL